MKRSSERRARRWVIQELTHSLNQLSDTTASVALSGEGNFSAGGEQSSLSKS
jgi:enoyl-CoA hydratase/carnithine racemase